MNRYWLILMTVIILTVGFGAFMAGNEKGEIDGHSEGYNRGYSEGYELYDKLSTQHSDLWNFIEAPCEITEPITVAEALLFLGQSKIAHQQVLDKPETLASRAEYYNMTVEKMRAYQQGWIDKYSAIQYLINELEAKREQ